MAYQVIRNGPVDIVYKPDRISHLEYDWEEPSPARFYGNCTDFSRRILFAKRAAGQSNRGSVCPTLEVRMNDAGAALERIGGPYIDTKTY